MSHRLALYVDAGFPPQDLVKQATMRDIVEYFPQLVYRKGLDKFYWPFQLEAAGQHQDHALAAIQIYLAALTQTRLEQPVLHLWGDPGTGKTHLGLGLAAYIMLNHWQVGYGKEDQFETFAYVDWPYFMQTQLDDEEPMTVNWEAQLLVLDDIDLERPIPRSGDPFRLTRLYAVLKQRLEQAQRPTILLTHHSIEDLERFLATNVRGEVANAEAQQWATRITMLIAGHTLARGRTYGREMRREIMRNPNYMSQVLNPLIRQQDMTDYFPKLNQNGFETRF